MALNIYRNTVDIIHIAAETAYVIAVAAGITESGSLPAAKTSHKDYLL